MSPPEVVSLGMPRRGVPPRPKPPWFKVRFPGGENYAHLKGLMRGLGLHTICEEAGCPNIGECWNDLTATFLILGDTCTRNCGFCSVKTGRPQGLDREEPGRVAQAVGLLGLRHVVITSVNRDELEDGGAEIFAATIGRIREAAPGCAVEVLIPDFRGSDPALRVVVDARPDVLAHNLETVPRLYGPVRPGSGYRRSLRLLEVAKDMWPGVVTKSNLLVGFGEGWDELLASMRDLRHARVDILTIGQYLRPTLRHLGVERYYPPEEFARLKAEGERMGFRHVESGPLVRTSYHAARHLDDLRRAQARLATAWAAT
jgi:lipoic acid synthetase